MYFGLSEDQTLLQDSLRGTLERNVSLEVVRSAVSGDATASGAVDDALSSLAIDHILVPESHGGLGLGVLEAALIQEMLGRYVVPSRFLSTAVATIGLIHAADSAQAAQFFSAMLDGTMRIGLGISEAVGASSDYGVVYDRQGLTGKAGFVLDNRGVHDATHYLILAHAKAGSGDDERCLALVSADAANMTHTPLVTIDKTRDFTTLAFEKTPHLMLKGTDHVGALAQMVAVARVLIAADTFGAAEMMLEKAVSYARERRQFNRVIGSFQAVKHMCAERAAALEPCRSLIWYAAYSYNMASDEFPLMSRHAKSLLGDVGQETARVTTEVHGGMGITELLGLHYWFKRIGVNRQWLGNPALVRKEAATLQFDTIS